MGADHHHEFHPGVFLMVQERDHMTVTDIEGSTAGWKPTHRRNFGKYTRDLCLQVHDISPPKCRYVRDPCSEVYEPVEGAHPQPRSRPRSPWSPVDSSLRTADIEGTEADSMLLKSKVKMRKKKSASRNMVTTQQEKAELVAVKLLKTRVLDQMKGKSCKEVVRAFKNKDRQASGKLTIDEVENVFRALDVGLNSAELRVFSTAFDSSIDGYLNYWQLIKHLVPVVPSKIKTPGATRVVPMALQGWSQTVEPQPCFFQKSRDETCATEKAHEISSQTGRLREAPKAVDKSTVEAETEKEEDKRDAALPWRRTHSMDLSRQRRQSVQLRGRQTSSPLPIGGAFWPEVKLIGSPVPPKSYLSLFHDHHEPHNISGYYRVLDDSERRWSTRVGENLYTGEANVVCSTSYSEGTQWTRPPSSQRRSSSRCSTPLVDTTRPSMAMSGRTSRPSTALSATRPSTAMSVYFDDDDNVSSRAAHYTDENSGYHQSRGGDVARKLKRPQSASTVLLRGGTPECLRTISNMNSVGLRPYTSHSAVRSRSPSNRLTMPHGVQRQLSQMMDDIAAVKALMTAYELVDEQSFYKKYLGEKSTIESHLLMRIASLERKITVKGLARAREQSMLLKPRRSLCFILNSRDGTYATRSQANQTPSATLQKRRCRETEEEDKKHDRLLVAALTKQAENTVARKTKQGQRLQPSRELHQLEVINPGVATSRTSLSAWAHARALEGE
ncbi:hypothetical protein SELMODRAFT_442845 [Selaginella moellendorffii]|uniref:EF-hand domain-containing protein n=1 Tax=Selaginella moellendorffii TaxID=88036 RepID=D8RWL2_SELML|nr:hypothetical protein SELMODRAFT_442845 [Selaginella moellendorffii]